MGLRLFESLGLVKIKTHGLSPGRQNIDMGIEQVIEDLEVADL